MSTDSNRGHSTWRGGRGRGRGRGRGGNRNSAARLALADIAKETKNVLPFILKDLKTVHADESEVWSLDALPPLKDSDCPKYPSKATIKVVNDDTFNAAIDLASKASADTSKDVAQAANPRVAVLNLASDTTPGGGWLTGATAQEEALCYRSSLALSLHERYYPLQPKQGIYTSDVVIIRSSMGDGHSLLAPAVAPADLPVVSVLSVAAIRRPSTKTKKVGDGEDGEETTTKGVFSNKADRDLTKDKMRLCMRMAAKKGHTVLVLGALGCGAFKNPTEDVADCWVEVLKEDEFSGGWWKGIWFAVFDRKNEGNFEMFEKALGGLEV